MIKKKIQFDVAGALKQGNQEVAGVLRMALAAITSKEKEKRYKIAKDESSIKEEDLIKESELTDDDIISVISSEVKKRKDAIVLYEKGNRPELANKEKKEIEILKKYLPEQLSADELKNLIKDSINKVGAKEIRDSSKNSGQVMGKIMADLMLKVKGRADNSEISKIIKELLQ